MEPFNQLSPGQAERLAITVEELGETVQAIGKILRHGYESRDPTKDPEKSNRRDLETELGDVYAAVDQMRYNGDVSPANIHRAKKKKLAKKERYLHHQDLSIAYNEKRVVIAGSRNWNDYYQFCYILRRFLHWIGPDNVVLISGNASRGADAMAIRFAMENDFPFETYDAEWDEHGKAAGFIRNIEMRNRCTHLLAFWDGQSRGTESMIDACMSVDFIHTMVYLTNQNTPGQKPKEPEHGRQSQSSRENALALDQ
jgi:hypothetical protein